MSSINTNGINVNYPVPGVNNNSQGFRDNFASIKTNLNTASTEITDLQNKVVVKQALTGTVIDNNMANTLISNASTRSFRATMYNLGGNLSGIVSINASLGDVQYGTINANTTLQFGYWPPAGTQSNIEVQFNIGNSNAYITFPSEAVFSNDTGTATIENGYDDGGGNLVISVPEDVTQLNFQISTVDCGNTLYITPINRPRQSTQIQTKTISPVGFPGDVSGAVSVGPSYNQLTITNTNAADYLTTSGSTTQLYTDMPITFSGTSLDANITAGTTYYVRNVVSGTTFTISSTLGGANVNLASNSGTMYANPVSSLFICTDSYNATDYGKTVSATNSSGNITLNNTTSLANNAPIIFTGDVVGGLVEGQVYYIKAIGSGGNITISQSRTNGVAGTATTLTTATPATALTANVYIGSDIWKKINLTSW